MQALKYATNVDDPLIMTATIMFSVTDTIIILFIIFLHSFTLKKPPDQQEAGLLLNHFGTSAGKLFTYDLT
jgi:hypothetical protein